MTHHCNKAILLFQKTSTTKTLNLQRAPIMLDAIDAYLWQRYFPQLSSSLLGVRPPYQSPHRTLRDCHLYRAAVKVNNQRVT